MTVYTIPVKPKAPTILDGKVNTVELPGYELWMTYIENVHVVPKRIGIHQFICALEESLQFYPHAAGQLCNTGDRWIITLTNSPIMLDVEELENSFDLNLEREGWVIQSDLRRFLRGRESQPSRYPADPSRTSTGSPEQEHSLLFIKLTVTSDETVIGVSWHHVLGDAAILLQFMLLLSRRYQGDDESPSPSPSFLKQDYGSPDPSLLDRYTPLMPHLVHTIRTSELGNKYTAMNAATAPVAFKVAMVRLRKLRDKVVDTGGSLIRPSLQDCLTAFVVTALNCYLEVPITRITNAAQYRTTVGAMTHPEVAGNAIYIIPTQLEHEERNLKTIACALRRSIIQCREPTFVKDYISVASQVMSSAVDEGRSMFFEAPPGQISVNSNLALDWHSVHFGYPGQARFHTSGINDRYVRVFFSNKRSDMNLDGPSGPESDGRWVDVFFAVAKDVRDELLSDIVNGLEDVDLTPSLSQ